MGDVNAIKALPPPPPPPPPENESISTTEVVEEEEKKEDDKKEGDLLDLGEDAITSEEHADKLALALFDGEAPATSNTLPALTWQAFNDETSDWESSLVQSASNLNDQKPTLPGGFDMLLLDGMYKQPPTTTTAAVGSGSGSSVAIGPPGMLALPAPPTSSSSSSDPFAASLGVAPPSYVQMSEMEKKQKLLVEEQLMWQQYQRDGMQGQLGIQQQHHNPYNMGGYTRSY